MNQGRPFVEPEIDCSLDNYTEGKALEHALAKADSADQHATISDLITLRNELMVERDNFRREATAKRHERGEIYSRSRIAAINSYTARLEDLESVVEDLYASQSTSSAVLRAHARCHFSTALVSSRSLLSSMPSNIAAAAEAMQSREEEFAKTWLDAIGDAAFTREIRGLQREAALMFRTSSTSMFLHTVPASDQVDSDIATILGKAWDKLESICSALGIKTLSEFVLLDSEPPSSAPSASELAATVAALISHLDTGSTKIPSKTKVQAALHSLKESLDACMTIDNQGRAFFEMDI